LISLELDNVGLRFYLYYHRPNQIREWVGLALARSKGEERKSFWALKDISLQLHHGEVLGVIGPNGAGKSTLLRLIGGIYQPDVGRVQRYDKISSLLALGTGFNNLLSGRENIRLNALLMGIPTAKIESMLEEIIEFAEVGQFIDVPLKYWSSGMFTRLTFAITLVLQPEVLLIDEVLSVGDLKFEKKAVNAMDMLRKKAKCQIIVSHGLEFIEKHCTRVICLIQGQIAWDGDAAEVVSRYREYAQN
jgi:ABC-type polysaccharide/polyol phosphate transport system ATPase subunit